MSNTFSSSGHTRVAPVDDVLVHYRRAGQGQPLLLIHGDTGNVVEQLTRFAAGVISRAGVPSILLGSCRTR